MLPYEERRRLAYLKALEGFQPDLSRCRNLAQAGHILALARDGLTTEQIAALIGTTPKAVQKFYRRYGFPALSNIAPRLEHEQPMWNGGTKLMKGYLYKRSPDHPNGTKHGSYVAVHRLNMEEKLGRYLLPTEVVDHIDGDITNNDPSNLRVFQSNAEHLRATLAGKCPQWTDVGKAALDHARRQQRRTWKGVAIPPNHDP